MTDDDIIEIPVTKPSVDIWSPLVCALRDATHGQEPGDECGRQPKKLWLAHWAENNTEAADWLSAYHQEVDFLGYEIAPLFTRSGRTT